jgi:alanine racemase
MPRPIRAAISRGALEHNLLVAKAYAAGAKIWAVIKANAYGHGLERAARALQLADGFAVLDFQEAERLRLAGVAKPILMLEGFFRPADIALIHKYGLTPVIHNPEQVEMLRLTALPGEIDVYVKVNSGMNRFGFTVDNLRAAYNAIRMHAQVRQITLMTHFADADGASGVAGQLKWFHDLTKDYQTPCSLANSAALIRFPEARGDWVRPGIMLYGCSPFADRSAASLELKPAMTLSSEIIATQLQAGERVGYGFGFEACAEQIIIGVSPAVAADELPAARADRHAGLSRGQRTRIVGRCLDGHDLRRHQRYPGGVHRHAGDALGRGTIGGRGGAAGTVRAAVRAAPRVPVADVP